MNISDEAVRAARAAFVGFPVEQAENGTLDLFRSALEAAAPHLMAAAWQEGFLEAIKAYAPTPSSGVMSNPYRAAGQGNE